MVNYVCAVLIVVVSVGYVVLCAVGGCRAFDCFLERRWAAGVLWLVPCGLLVSVILVGAVVSIANTLEGVV